MELNEYKDEFFMNFLFSYIYYIFGFRSFMFVENTIEV